MKRLTDITGQLYACGNNLCEEGMSCAECRYREEAEKKLAAYEDAEEQGRIFDPIEFAGIAIALKELKKYRDMEKRGQSGERKVRLSK